MLDSLLRNLRDASDILKRARNPAELAKGLVPNRWLARQVLNQGDLSQPGSNDPAAIAEALRSLRNELKATVINEHGQVDYARVGDSDILGRMRSTASLLRAVDPKQLDDDSARNTFWINLYNVLAIHGVLELGIRESVMEIPSFFGTVAYDVGGFVLTLDEIENGVLRRNAPHPATGQRPFANDDARTKLSPTVVDPRIHAALVCASTSCPPVAFYDAERLDAQLDVATAGYVAADVVVDDDRRTIRIPITFRYYNSDFGGPDGVRSFLLDHAQGEQRSALERAFDARFPIEYHRYDWSLNRIV